jgi:TolB-like protein/DNA-binding winged helix-turn-helix (wHTH) protein
LGVPIGIVKFAEFELDGGRYELRRGDRVLKLEKIPMELLTLLAESNGRLVTRDEIVEKIWGKDVFVDTEHGINTAIRKIRQALGDDSEKPRFVLTVTGKGYRFIAPATSIEDRIEHRIDDRGNGDKRSGERAPVLTASLPAAIPVGNAEISPPSDNRERAAQPVSPAAIPVLSRSRWLGVALALVVLASLTVAVIKLDLSAPRDWPFVARAVKPQIHSLAVLPLENLSGDPAQEYFADGMTDEVITMLAKNPGLRVISRTSVMRYKKVHRPLREIAGELGVDGILEGSVGRTGNRVHVTAQLIHAASDTHVWAESFDRDLSDVGSVQNELAQTIAKQVAATTSAPGSPAPHINPEAHDAYLLGRYYWFAEADEYEKSRGYFQRAIDLQPDYAAAWSGLADSYALGEVAGKLPPEAVMLQAEAAAKKALELDDLDAEAHKSMAAIQLFYRWDWKAAERESVRALELNPNFAEGHHLRAYVLRSLNRMDEAVQEEKKTMELDPFAKPFALGFALIRARQFDAALNEARIRSDAQPNNAGLHLLLSYAYFFKGMEKASEEESEHYLQLAGEKDRLAEQVQAYRRGGLPAVRARNVDRLKRTAAKQYVSPSDFVDAYAELRRKEETIYYLEQSYRERSPYLVFLQSDPNFDFLHSDPRYRAIVNKMGLPPAY